MADVQYDFNPIDWSGFSTDTVVLDEGYALWFSGHPDGDGYCQVIGDGASVVDDLVPLFVSGAKYLSSGRKFAHELSTPITYTTSGWKEIAKTTTNSYQNANADFKFDCLGNGRNSTLGCKVAFTDGSQTKELGVNCDIKRDIFGAAQGNVPGISSFRIGTAAGAGAGAVLEVYVDVGISDVTITPPNITAFVKRHRLDIEHHGNRYNRINSWRKRRHLPRGRDGVSYHSNKRDSSGVSWTSRF